MCPRGKVLGRVGFGVGGRGGPGLWEGSPGPILRTTDLTRLEVATNILYPAVSLSSRATGEATAPARPRYLLRKGIQGAVEAKGGAKGSGEVESCLHLPGSSGAPPGGWGAVARPSRPAQRPGPVLRAWPAIPESPEHWGVW